MDSLPPQLTERARKLAAEKQNTYTPGEWIWALNLQAGDDPKKLRTAALILEEMKPYLPRQSGD